MIQLESALFVLLKVRCKCLLKIIVNYIIKKREESTATSAYVGSYASAFGKSD